MEEPCTKCDEREEEVVPKFVDQFRAVDRKVKSMVKQAELESTTKQRKKRAWEEAQGISRIEEWKEMWNTVVDVPRSEENVNFVTTLTRCCGLNDHNCQCSGETKVYELSSYPPGLFIVRNALCQSQQQAWAKIALEDYSREDHTNLSNLTKLNETESENNSSSLAEDNEDIWRKSCADHDGFQRLRKLRWSCLGYHYGKFRRQFSTRVNCELTILFISCISNI